MRVIFNTAPITSRERAQDILLNLAGAAGARERAILQSPAVVCQRSADYPGCFVCHADGASMVYRPKDNRIIG